jgi:hypothetical protein
MPETALDVILADIVDRAADELDVPMHLTYREIRGILGRAVLEARNYGASEGK